MSDYPSVRPSLNLNFARTKKLDPRVTFRRASTGTYVDSDGLIKTAGINVPRFDHDPVTGVCKGLLVEESRTNLRTSSSTTFFPVVGSWSFAGVSSDIIAPDGSTSTYKVVSNGSGQDSIDIGYLSVTLTLGVTYTISAYYYAIGNSDSARTVRLAYNVGSGSGTVLPFSKWTRLSFTFTATETSSTRQLKVIDNDQTGFNTSAGATIYLWGAQIEAGSFPTSYIPTAGSTVTRSADVASITGANFSSWFNSAQGSFFINAENYGLASAIKRLAYDGVWNHAFALGTGTPSASRVMTPYYIPVGNNTVSAGQFFYNGGGTDFGAGIANQIPFGSNVNKMSMYMDIPNKRYAIASAGKLGTLNTDLGRSGADSYRYADMMRVGYNSDYYGTYNGAIAQITYWPQRLTNSQLLALIKS